MEYRKIEILESDSNKKGDLFNRLMLDFFHSLGYSTPLQNVHKPGREIDIQAFHRIENKIAIVESKAHSAPIGGSEINKFRGICLLEKEKIKKNNDTKNHSVVCYYAAQNGFTQSALVQEADTEDCRIILLEPKTIIDELISGRVLVSVESAVSSINIDTSKYALLEYVDLLAYEKGWVWALYYSENRKQKPTHYALVHAEGNPLIKDLADEIISIDSNLHNVLGSLSMFDKIGTTISSHQDLESTKKKYFTYLENELGEIRFDGMPVDFESATVNVKLENIFIPLHLHQSKKIGNMTDSPSDVNSGETIGNILNTKTQLAILAKPGGGKSTLIKRIALSYAFPERRSQIRDQLPDRNWFPIFLRCRQFGDKVKLSITEIINNIRFS